MVDAMGVLRVLLLLGVANGVPVVAKKLLGRRFDWPLDSGLRLVDGQPLFGASKTIRGIVLSMLCTALAAIPLDVAWTTGAGVGAAAMAGDLFSSFVKRRLKFAVHAQSLGVDQVPEALLPMLLLRTPLGLSVVDIGVVLVGFVVLELALSRVLFWLRIRDRPY